MIVSQISIPYGAIKSMLVKMGVGLASRFQFLMVRLKAETTGVDKLSQRNFNSLWCD